MKKSSHHSPTLAELAAEFLSNIPQKDKGESQIEVHKFIRWLGSERKPNGLNPNDIANYGEHITPSEAKTVKSFLTYIKKKGVTTINLASHVRPKKVYPKNIISLGQNSQGATILSEEGRARLETELTSLKDQRSHVIEEMQKAAADKDFRENAPLAAARERKAQLDGRIQELEATLKMVKLMGESQRTSKVEIGNTVVLYDLSLDKQFSYVLVDPREANPARGNLSITSPLGKALLDKERGQTVEVSAPAGVFSYRINDIQHN